MPPVAMTVTYAETNGISLSKAEALSPAFIIGVIINIIMTYTGAGMRKIKGSNLKKYRRTNATMVTGVVKKARKNIKEI